MYDLFVLYQCGDAAEQRHPNAFTIQVSNPENLTALELIKAFPFRTNNLRVFALERLISAQYVWIELKKPDNKLATYGNSFAPFIILNISPKGSGVYPTTSRSTQWWDLLVTENAPREVKQKEALTAYSGFPDVSVAINKGNDVMQKGINTLAAWAKSGISKAADLVGTSEIVMLEKSQVTLEKKIAEGGFSQVYLAKAKIKTDSPSTYFALKRCIAQNKEDFEALKQEINMHKIVSCPHVLELIDYGIIQSKQLAGAREVLMLLPLLNKTGSMYDQMAKYHEEKESRNTKWPYPEKTAAKLLIGVCKGLKSIHEAGYTHRDIKPHNVLFKCNGNVAFPQDAENVIPVLMDLGSCAKREVKVKNRKEALMIKDEASIKSSAPYRPPELIEVEIDSIIDSSADLWAIGCMMYALTYGAAYSPFEHPIHGVMNLAILQGQVKFPENNMANGYMYSENWKTLIRRLLKIKPRERLSLDETIQKLYNMAV